MGYMDCKFYYLKLHIECNIAEVLMLGKEQIVQVCDARKAS